MTLPSGVTTLVSSNKANGIFNSKLSKSVQSMFKSGGDESKRAPSALKSIAKECPKAFQNIHNQHVNASNSEIKMEASAVLGMMSEANTKFRQLRAINRCVKHGNRGNMMCKEEEVRKMINSHSIVKSIEFEETIDINLT